MPRDEITLFTEQLAELGVTATFVGCTTLEIAELESRYRVKLPRIYRRYLEVMGHEAYRLFSHDHVEVSYRHVLELTSEERTYLEESPPENGFGIPENALLISSRLGDQFNYIVCNDPDDSAVWYYNAWDYEAKQCLDSILDWLRGWMIDAKHAIESGYYERFPGGTSS